ncbi:hypothetical protein YYE_04982 [Plasmodium vinckei vinckei]|uniref:PIR protein CIR protein n=1 Tax=Plasmodium vinckei vinckei TaxID=54757 RepID=A0A081I913_PLAVN|nr:hypothetical protein YYE_04982 [Plasmodium vinckei vinckei]
MEKHQKMCEFLIKGDSYFNDENVNTNEINKDLAIKGFCNNGGCKINEASINALADYIIMSFKRSISDEEFNKYDECFLMWISDKLLKMHLETIGKKDKPGYMDGTTLNDGYEKYLKNHKGILDYWVLFDNIKGLKEANLKYMSEYYKLLNRICKTIVYYEKNNAESKELSNYFNKCLIQYRTLYMNISECKPYLDLLNKLKGIYDDFRSYAITKNSSNNNLATNLKKLTKPNGEEMDAVRSFISYKIPKKKCNSLDKKAASVPLQFSSKEESPLPQEPEKKETELQSLPESAPQSSELQQTPAALPAPPQAQKQDSISKPPSPEQSKDQSNEQKDSDGSSNDQDGTDSDPVEDGTQSTEGDLFNIEPLIFSIALKGMEKLNDANTSYEMIKNKFKGATKHIHNLYNTTLPSVQNAFNKFSDFFNGIIDNVSNDSKQVNPPADSDDKQSDSGGGEDGSSQPQKNSEQTSSETSPSPTEENKTDQSSQDSSENHNSDQNGQESEQPVEVPVIIPTNPECGIKGNGTIGIGDIFIFKEFKKIGIPTIVIIISITLAIMYKVNKRKL